MIPLQFWLQCWLANFNGMLIISCALITFDTYFSQVDILRHKNNIFKFSSIYGFLSALILILLYCHTPFFTMCFALSIVIYTVFISIWFGWCGAVFSIFLFGMAISLASYLKLPLFSTYFSSETFVYLQRILTINTITGLTLGIRSTRMMFNAKGDYL